MAACDLDALLAHAMALRCAAEAGAPPSLLRGRNLGLMCAAQDGADAALFRRAATELGAKVAQIEPRLTLWSPRIEMRQTARVLGRLYDAIECQGIAPALVRQLSEEAGVPFFDGIAAGGHETAVLAERLGGTASIQDNRRFVVQAILLEAIA